MDFRELTSDDEQRIHDLYARVPQVFKHDLSSDSRENAAKALVENLKENPHGVLAMGAFDGSELQGAVCGYRWRKLPYYTIRDLKSYNPQGSMRRYIEVFDRLLSHLLQTMEKERRLDFYFVNFQRNFHKTHFEEQGELRTIPRYFSYAQRYELSVQEVIPPGEDSRFGAFEEMMDRRRFPVPVWVRRGSLKAEFRNELWRV